MWDSNTNKTGSTTLKEWTTPNSRNTLSTTNLEEEETVDTPWNAGNSSMLEQVKWPNPWKKMMMIIMIWAAMPVMHLLCLWSFHCSINQTTYLDILWDWFVLQIDNLGLTAQVCFWQDKTANFAINTWKFLSKAFQDTWFFSWRAHLYLPVWVNFPQSQTCHPVTSGREVYKAGSGPDTSVHNWGTGKSCVRCVCFHHSSNAASSLTPILEAHIPLLHT